MKMYNSNHISMGFGVCKCKACRHLIQDRDGTWFKHHKNSYRDKAYRGIIKRLRQNKHNPELPYRLFNTGSYTD